MRCLGIDYGTKFIGISISDETNTIANPLCVINYNNMDEVIDKLNELINEYNINKIILGYPLNMNGTISVRSKEVLAFKEIIEVKLKKEVILIDERLTSVIANNLLISNDTSRKKRKKVVDKISAAIILQSYLDRS